jgi:PRTRC genetic system protein E
MFFREINTLTENFDFLIKISAKQGLMSVLVSPQPKKEINDKLKPITITGTPEELDEKFISIIKNPIENSTTLVHNISVYEDALKKKFEDTKKKVEDKKNSTQVKTIPSQPKTQESPLKNQSTGLGNMTDLFNENNEEIELTEEV